MSRHQWNLSQIQREALRELPIFTERVMFECKQGWYNLIYDLGSKISGYCIHNNIPIPAINQIKEKFGTLRFYYLFKGKEQIDKIKLIAKIKPYENKEPRINFFAIRILSSSLTDDGVPISAHIPL